MTYLQGCGYGQQDGGPLQLLVQRGDHVARVRDLPQQPAEVAAGEVVQEPALALQGPRTRGSKQVDNIDVGADDNHIVKHYLPRAPRPPPPRVREVERPEDGPDRGAGQEVDEVLADVDEDIIDVEDAGVDGVRVDAGEHELLLRLDVPRCLRGPALSGRVVRVLRLIAAIKID